MKQPKLEWSDYFSGNPTTTLGPGEYKTTQTYSVSNVYILNCLFNGCTSGSNGGALYCSSSVTYLLVESSSFFSCKTSGSEGGAIYFSNTSNGQCVLHKVCGYDCYSTYTSSYSYGQFARIYVRDAASNKNYANYSSVARCVIMNSYSYIPLRLQYGKICCPSVNSSMNKCYYPTGIYYEPFVDSNTVTGSFSYSSFTDNIGTGYTCIRLYGSGVNYEIKSCNILRNSHVSTSEGIIHSRGNTIISDSCILENIGTYIFYISSPYTITLTNCTVDKTTRKGSLIIQNTATTSFILALNHMSTRNCHSEYDSAGTLTPIIHSPSSSKKRKLYYSCDKFLLQYQLSDKFSLINILIFNFIYTYDSNDPFY
jgi:hypothetical protein